MSRRLAALLLLAFVQGCYFGQSGPEATGLVPNEPELFAAGRRATLHWEPRVQHALSRLPGGRSRDVTTLVAGGLDRTEPIQDLQYDIEIYLKISDTVRHARVKDDYGRLWKAFWTKGPYDDGESDIEREQAYQLIHTRQGIRETEYAIPFELVPNAVYAWRVRPVYGYRGRTVAEDWMRENITTRFGFISYGNSIDEFITTSPLEFVSPASNAIK